MKEVAQIRTGHFPHWFALRPDGKVLFVSLWFSDVVAAIDIASRKVLANIQFERGRLCSGSRNRTYLLSAKLACLLTAMLAWISNGRTGIGGGSVTTSLTQRASSALK